MRVLVLLVVLIVYACVNDNDHESEGPAVITIGVLPDQSIESLSTRYAGLISYLEQTADINIVLSIPANYEEMLDEFDAGRLDVANFGGVTFIQAERRSGAVPLVMRDIDRQFKSCYLVKPLSSDTPAFADFKDKTFSFGPRLSTSGHIMPRHFLATRGVVPKDYFSSIRHSSGHDETAIWVAEGDVAMGVANCDIVQSMFDNGQFSKSDVIILETTPPYTDYVWATQRSLDPSVKNQLKDAFLALDMTNLTHRMILKDMGAGGYLPAGKSDFDEVRAAARVVGLLD